MNDLGQCVNQWVIWKWLWFVPLSFGPVYESVNLLIMTKLYSSLIWGSLWISELVCVYMNQWISQCVYESVSLSIITKIHLSFIWGSVRISESFNHDKLYSSLHPLWISLCESVNLLIMTRIHDSLIQHRMWISKSFSHDWDSIPSHSGRCVNQWIIWSWLTKSRSFIESLNSPSPIQVVLVRK